MKSSHKFNSSRKLPIKDQKPNSIVVRLMTPFSIECTQCNGYISKFRKFNGKKTEMKEKYLNKIKMFQLTIKCPSCNNSISFRTDPATADYVMLSGGVRMSGVSRASNDETSTDNNNGNEGDEVDDVLERLLREEKEEQEQEEAKQQLNKNGNGTSSGTGGNANKLEDLEDKLIKLQKEQEQDVELENLRKQVNLQNQVSQSDKSAHHMSELEDKQFDTEYQSMVSSNIDRSTFKGSRHVHMDKSNGKSGNADNDEIDKNSSSNVNVSRIVKKKKKKKVITI